MAKKVYFLGVDIGFGSTVVSGFSIDKQTRVVEEIASTVFPSRLKLGASLVQNVFASGTPVNNTYSLDGVDYTVDESLSAESTRDMQDYHYNYMQSIFLQHAFQLVGLKKDDEVHVTLGLPLSLFYTQDNQRNNENIDRKIKNLRENIAQPKVGDAVVPASIHVQPEAMGCFFNYVLRNDGSVNAEHYNSNVAILDLGAQTADSAVISSGAVNFSRTRSRNIGVLNIFDNLRMNLEKDYGIKETHDDRLERILRENRYTYKSRQFSEEEIQELRKKSILPVFKQLKNFVGEMLGEAGDIDRIIVVGGGANIFGEWFEKLYNTEDKQGNHFEQVLPVSKLSIPPQFWNARGFALYLVNQYLTNKLS